MSTLNLPYKRFVAQVSTGAPRPKSTYLSLMAENLEALKACPWREVADVPVALVSHDFTAASHFSAAYDAFKMTGAWDAESEKEVAFAGMAAYRFAIPESAASVAISSVTLPISRDRFLLGGVHVAAVLDNSATPSTDWAVVTGQGASAYLVNAAANIVASRPADGALTINSTDLSSLATTGKTYLWIYVTLEDYVDWWQQYSATEARQYAIEGSAMLVGGSATVTFDGEVTPDAEPAVLLAGGSSPTWLEPLPTANAGADAPEVPQAPLVENLFSDQRTIRTNLEITHQFIWSAGGKSGTFSVTTSGRGVKSATGSGLTWSVSGNSVSGTGTYSGHSLSISFSMSFADDTDGDAEYAMVTGSGRVTYAGSSTNLVGSAQRHRVQDIKQIYFMLVMEDGALVDADMCATASEDSRLHTNPEISGDASPWTVSFDGREYSVSKSGRDVTMKKGASTTIYSWTIAYGTVLSFFDAAVSLRIPGNEDVSAHGLAAVVGDCTAAVATYEPGTQPSHAEMLGRLARMSRAPAGDMLYLHPESGALADELDTLRPVPRFFRVASGSVPIQSTCQPGLSVWYRRPGASSASAAFAYRDAIVSVTMVQNPAFLQLALLACRAPAAFSTRLVLANFKPDATTPTTNVATAVTNHFKLRFVAWRSPAEQWDGSNAYAMAAMASMPSVYRADGPSSVAWSVDCTGDLLRFGARAMTAERIGVSPTIIGNIAASAEIEIPIASPVGEGDVVLIAPEVLGFADGAGGESKWFGRPSDPSQGTAGWARYAHNLGWFPRVTGI